LSELADWSVMLRAFPDAGEWLLDVAAHTAREFPDEVATVERVRTFMRARNAGRLAHLRIEDLLFTFGLVLAAIEKVKMTNADRRHILAAGVLRAAGARDGQPRLSRDS